MSFKVGDKIKVLVAEGPYEKGDVTTITEIVNTGHTSPLHFTKISKRYGLYDTDISLILNWKKRLGGT